MVEAKFNIGDLVIHRASRDKGIILHVHQVLRCINPDHKDLPFVHMNGFTNPECQLETYFLYVLSTGFNSTIHDVPEVLLEILPDV